MVWIRSPAWDSAWILSGAPLGLFLLFFSDVVPAVLLTFWITLILQQAHNLAPIVMAWGNAGFREHMLRNKGQFVVLPAVLLAASVGVGEISSIFYPSFFPFYGTKINVYGLQGWQSPLGLMLAVYFVWNTYHFAKQNFGVLSIYRTKSGSGRRRADLIYALSVTVAVTIVGIIAAFGYAGEVLRDMCMFGGLAGVLVMLSLETRLSPRIPFILADAARLGLMFGSGLWVFAISGMNHWLAAIGLASHVYANNQGRSPLAVSAGLITIGTLVFMLLFAVLPLSGIYSTSGPQPLPWWIRATIPAVSLRLGLGFVHFLYDRWLWKLSDPQVRSTIGRALTARRREFLHAAAA